MSARRFQKYWAATGLICLVVGSLLGGSPAASASSQDNHRSGRPLTPLLPPTQAFQQPLLAPDPARPSRVALAYQEGSKLEECYLALSSDGGVTWHTTSLVGAEGGFPLPAGTVHCYNPAVAYGPNDAVYYVFQDSGFRRQEPTALNVFVLASYDGGVHFAAPAKLDPGASDPNDWYPDVAVDQKTGKVYVAWARYLANFAAFPGYIMVASSTDGAKSFSSPVRIDPPEAPQYVGGPYVAAGGDGRLYLTFLPGQRVVDNKFVATPDALQVAVSSDGGTTFMTRPLAPVVKTCVGMANCDKLVPFSNNESIATSGVGKAYVAWWDDSGPGQLPRILFSSSSDGGRSWASPKTLAVPAESATDQLFDPWISVAPNGRIDLAYYRLTGDGLLDVYRSSSNDAGATFTTPLRLDGVASGAKVGPSAGGRLTASFGDHLAVASSDSNVVMAWTDSSRGNLTTGHQDIFVAAQPFGGHGGFPVWGYALLAVGVVLLLIVIFVWVTRRNHRRSAPPPALN